MTEEKPDSPPPEKAASQAAPQTVPDDVSLTREELVAKLEQLSTRAKAAGLSPLQVMAQTYVKRGMKALDSLLEALEEETAKTEDVSAKKKA